MSHPHAARACAVLTLAAALLGACGDDDVATDPTTTTTAAPAATSSTTAVASTTSTTPTTAAAAGAIEVVFAGGSVVGGVRTETVRLGDQVRLRVTSDVAEEVHVHAYDVFADVAAGATAELDFTATIPGRFEVELEEQGKQLLVLEVR